MEYIYEADTIELAIAKGLQENNWKESQVHVDIIEQGSKSFFAKRPAKVKLRLKNEEIQESSDSIGSSPEEPITTTQPARNLPGTFDSDKVRWEQEALVYDITFHEKKVVIHPPDQIPIMLNDKCLSAEIEIQSDDRVTLSGLPNEPREWIQKDIDSKKLYVVLTLNDKVSYELICSYKMSKDQVDLYFTECKREHIPFQTRDVLAYLQKEGIAYGLQKEDIDHWLSHSPADTSVVAAKGEPPLDGKPTEFVHLFNQQKKDDKIESEHTVNWFALQDIESVRAGDKIIEIVPATEGKEGKNIFNQPIPAMRGRETPAKLAGGVELSEDHRFVLATVDGKPTVSKTKICVNPQYVVQGDLTLEIGSIKFSGDVLVTGDVLEGLSISATGSVDIQGAVTNAKIEAGQHVAIKKNIIGSHVTSGGSSTHFRKTYHLLAELLKKLQVVQQAFTQLHKSSAGTPTEALFNEKPGQVIKSIIDNQFPHIGEAIRTVDQQHDTLDNKWIDLSNWIDNTENKLTGMGPMRMEDKEELQQLITSGQDIAASIKDTFETTYDVYAYYIHNSTVRSSGSIFVDGLGSYNSELASGLDIIIQGRLGIFRGGQAHADGKLVCKSLGGAGEVKTRITLPSEHGYIKTDQVFSGVVIEIKGYMYHVQEARRQATYEYDPHTQQIKAISLKPETA